MNDFSSRAKELTVIEQDTLAEIGNISMGSAATALSALVNRKVRITVPEVSVRELSDVRASYPVPCLLVNVQYLSGLQGENILVIREKDALVIGNLMMGEDGLNPPTELDEIYLSAVSEAMNMMMGSAATAMSELFKDTIEISPPALELKDLSQEPLVNEVPEQEPVVTVAFRIEIDDLVDSTMLQLIDVDFAKSMVAKLMPSEEPAATTVEEIPTVDVHSWTDLGPSPPSSSTAGIPQPSQLSSELGNLKVDLIKDIPVTVRAVLGRTRMTIDHILRLGPGNIVELDSIHGEPIEIYANDTFIARGEVVVVGEQFGIRVTEIASPQDRIVSVR
ncbi:MAG: flagellar motor switch phosphatase FliY [Firmicutes bacterium]|jgi:flagellar motor switch protein FliN/FliY|nr:flagellar motor switch phosphatase FliY [Bacillota bacterium]